MSSATPAALSIAGSDSSAGAGLQADIKTFSALGVYGATVVTAVTAQNTLGVTSIQLVPAEIISAQLDAVFSDLSIKAVKSGMLGSEEGVIAVAAGLERWSSQIPIIVDPVLISTSGSRLLAKSAEKVLIQRLIPLAALITPNLHEAAALLDSGVAQNKDEMQLQAERLLALGPRAVIIKGGHLSGPEATDLFFDGSHFRSYSAPRIAPKNTHGTGCTLSSAIAAFLVKGLPMEEAIAEAKAYVQGAILQAAGLHIGAGAGPLWHFYRQTPLASTT
jgi:hydroxymethylpyrimidine/phosphomethylpyrimidine kinase